MLSRKRTFVAMSLILLALLGFVYTSAQTNRRDRRATQVPTQPPTVTLSAERTVLTICPRDTSQAPPQVQLRADARSPEGNPLRYTWTTTAGRIIGDGPNPTWDLSGVQPGTYTAAVEVNSGTSRDCVAFSSAVIVINECPPLVLAESCPNISIYCPDTVILGSPVTFSADISGGTANVKPIYQWTVSAGRIISGQGTPSISVDTTGLGDQDIKATLEVGGYGLVCSASCTTQIPTRIEPRKFDEFGDISRNDEKARLDNFAIQLQNEPNAQGYIVVFNGRRSRPGDAQRRLERARQYLIYTRGIDASRIVTMTGGTRDLPTVELWIVPRGANPPSIR